MAYTRILLLLSLTLLLVTAGCTYTLPGLAEEAEENKEHDQAVFHPPDETPQPVSTDQPATQVSARGVTSVARMEIWAETMDFGGFHDMDGLIIKYRFFDSMNRPVSFERTSISMEVSIYSPETDRRNNPVTPRRLYRGFYTIHRSLPEDNYQLRGIWIPYSDIDLKSLDRGIGRIDVKATMPHGPVFEAEERYFWPVR
ncbi:MAG: hypothetical protein D5R99_06905 [Methanocalculus sp. MSAO_Arc1]|uniref:hypothetical protein n=1 Tax=Methanocalculus TaxID=71151 RepID=UPI000FF1DDF4|nr:MULTISPECIES: hypothetical protein [unclassified Methanocalculus]MCP1663056.1 hypothetical protein [Methanocalculus sp. AMF5]RQD79835.1 MAG: hypothetical protein D5R99_06905 [Methanocalculus sp. MSAO_Arc1]